MNDDLFDYYKSPEPDMRGFLWAFAVQVVVIVGLMVWGAIAQW